MHLSMVPGVAPGWGVVTGQIEVRINKTFNLSGGGGEGLGTCDLKKAPSSKFVL